MIVLLGAFGSFTDDTTSGNEDAEWLAEMARARDSAAAYLYQLSIGRTATAHAQHTSTDFRQRHTAEDLRPLSQAHPALSQKGNSVHWHFDSQSRTRVVVTAWVVGTGVGNCNITLEMVKEAGSWKAGRYALGWRERRCPSACWRWRWRTPRSLPTATDPPPGGKLVPEQCLILVICRDEKQQVALRERFRGDGLECKALLG